MSKVKCAADDVPMRKGDLYFSVDVETDGPIPGPYSLLSFAIVTVAKYDGQTFSRVPRESFTASLRPISTMFEADALRVNKIDRDRLITEGDEPADAMTRAARWIAERAEGLQPIFVAYPLGFDWIWLYWYFVRYSAAGLPFKHSAGFDIKTAFAIKAKLPVSCAGRATMPDTLRGLEPHTHDALDDAVKQGEIFARLFEWKPAFA